MTSPAPAQEVLPPAAAPAPVLPLPYADLPARSGVTLERDPSGRRVRITLPPPRLADMIRAHPVATVFVCYVATSSAGSAVNQLVVERSLSAFLPSLVSTVVVWGMIAAGIWGVLRKRIILDLTDRLLTVAVETPLGRWRTRRWPRQAVGDVRGDLHAMGLTIRITGKDMVELLHDQPQAVRVWIAGVLRAALGLAPRDAQADPAAGALR